jgi:hypothetical protein
MPCGLSWAQPQKNKRKKQKNKKIEKIEKNKNKKYACMNKNNVNLLVYLLTPESVIKISV